MVQYCNWPLGGGRGRKKMHRNPKYLQYIPKKKIPTVLYIRICKCSAICDNWSLPTERMFVLCGAYTYLNKPEDCRVLSVYWQWAPREQGTFHRAAKTLHHKFLCWKRVRIPGFDMLHRFSGFTGSLLTWEEMQKVMNLHTPNLLNILVSCRLSNPSQCRATLLCYHLKRQSARINWSQLWSENFERFLSRNSDLWIPLHGSNLLKYSA